MDFYLFNTLQIFHLIDENCLETGYFCKKLKVGLYQLFQEFFEINLKKF